MKTPLQKTRKKADTEFQKKCMGKGGLCELCKIKPAYCCHHIIAKSLSNRLRYELKNGLKVCVGCHNKIHSLADPAIFKKIIDIIGKKRYNWLEKIRREKVRTNLKWYKENLDKLEKI